jgi:Na+-translocating ferredoxin:NAD+ oxidoreductase RnfC subunit
MAELCCSCGLCTLYACPEDLYPKEACDKAKLEMRSEGIKFVQTKPVKVHPIKEGRRVPLKQLVKRLNVQDYDVHTPFNKNKLETESVKIILKQHLGEPAIPVVKIGEKVTKGSLIAKAMDGKLSANIHSSINGIVSQVTDDYIRINK